MCRKKQRSRFRSKTSEKRNTLSRNGRSIVETGMGYNIGEYEFAGRVLWNRLVTIAVFDTVWNSHGRWMILFSREPLESGDVTETFNDNLYHREYYKSCRE